MKIRGFDQFGKELKKLQKKAQELEKGQSISFVDLFHDGFMRKFTKFDSIDDFFKNSPFEFETNEDFEKIDETELDKYVAENTRFSSWQDMLGTAGKEHIARQLKF
jgi:transcriptional regulator of nitric oxide reductase